MTRTDTLYMKEGTADKVYTLNLESASEQVGGFTVTCFYGRRGSTMAQQSKTPNGPVSLEAANKIYDRMLKEKLAKGYRPGEGSAHIPFTGNASIPLDSPVSEYRPMLLNSITDPEPYLTSKEWVIQEKADGVRAIAHIGAEVRAYSRTGLPVAITEASAKILTGLFEGCIVDVEVIGEKVIVFDLLSHCGTDLREYSCADRLKALASKFPRGSARSGIVKMIHTEYTERGKREMYAALHAEGAEGVVFKLASATYNAGRPSSGGPALKLKFVASCSARVVAIGTKGKASVDVALADGTVVASVSTIGRPVPPIGAICEIAYLYAMRGGRLVQPVYKTIRTDVEPDTAESLQYKGEER
jgi:bifunctional non-homologous end joining protein LigD